MTITFPVTTDISPAERRAAIDHAAVLRKAFRRPVEAMWKPSNPLVACEEDHSLVAAVHDAFFMHHPLVLSPDAVWLTLGRGFANHVNLNNEELRHRFVKHAEKEKIVITRMDFLPGADNPWPEVFDAFSDQIAARVGKLRDYLRCDFSTTGPSERAVADLLVMDTFQAYFEYEMRAGCGIPSITLTGTVEDWKAIKNRAALFAEFGLEEWSRALEPVLSQFVAAATGDIDTTFWQSMFRYHSGSGPSVMTGWITVLFPYLKDEGDRLYPNPYLEDWEHRLEIDNKQNWRERMSDPQGVGMGSVPTALASSPVKVYWGDREEEMLFVGGLIGVSQDEESLALRPECGWVILYEQPVDPLSPQHQREEEFKHAFAKSDE